MYCEVCEKDLEQYDECWIAYDGGGEARAMCYLCLRVLWDALQIRMGVKEDNEGT